jgi:hypothetical protein
MRYALASACLLSMIGCGPAEPSQSPKTAGSAKPKSAGAAQNSTAQNSAAKTATTAPADQAPGKAAAIDPQLQPLIAGAAGADRFVVYDHDTSEHLMLPAAAVDELWSFTRVEQVEEGYYCLCSASYVIYFYRGEEFKVALAIHAFEGHLALGWEQGPYEGDLTPTDASGKKLIAWCKGLTKRMLPLDDPDFEPPVLE